MEIELWNGETKAIIDPNGAWLTNLSDQSGDIFFPKRSLKAADGSQKVRGGSHVCLPQFGPDASGEQLQHGYARATMWSVVHQDMGSVTLLLNRDGGKYSTLDARLTYEVLSAGIRMQLEVRNEGVADVRISPAFHPYFSLGRTEREVTMDGEVYQLEELAEAQFVKEGDAHTLTTQSREFTLRAKGLPMWAQWTDSLATYVCFEPTLAGFSFLNDVPQEEEIVRPGQHRDYELLVEWRAATAIGEK